MVGTSLQGGCTSSVTLLLQWWQAIQDINGRLHIRLNFRGTQRPIVDPYLVNAALEVFPELARANLQGLRRLWYRSGRRHARHLHAIPVEAHRRPIVGDSQMRPGGRG